MHIFQDFRHAGIVAPLPYFVVILNFGIYICTLRGSVSLVHAVTSIFGYKVSERVYHDPVTFRADHPFIFAIWDDETNVILFMGKMSDPTV